MNTGGFDSFDECEPRTGLGPPVKAERINITMVPEVSLIFDKPEASKKTISHHELHRSPSHESYATWRKNNIPEQDIQSPVVHSPMSIRKDQYEKRGTKPTNEYHHEFNGHKHHNSPSMAGTNDKRRYNHEYDASNRNEYIQQRVTYKNYNEPSKIHDIDHNYKRSSQASSPKNYLRKKSGEMNYNQNSCTHSNTVQPYHGSYQSPQPPQHNYDSGILNCMQRGITRHGNYSNDHEYHSWSPHRGYSQPEHFRPEYPSYSSSHYTNSNSEQSETIKNLLHLINSQNEQIKSLLKMHEENMQKRNMCTCQLYGNVPIQNLASETRKVQCVSQRNDHLQPPVLAHSDELTQDEETKQTILEQKVSIGVMTSFEFKVQNNPPFLLETEKRQVNYDKETVSNDSSNITLTGSLDVPRKKSTLYTPTALENISEGSESRHQSSNCTTNSTRQSLDCSDEPRQFSHTINPEEESPTSNQRLQHVGTPKIESIQQKDVDIRTKQQHSNSYEHSTPHLKTLKKPYSEEPNQKYHDSNENLLENHGATDIRHQLNTQSPVLKEQSRVVVDNIDPYQRKLTRNTRNSLEPDRENDRAYKPWKQETGNKETSRNGRYRYEESLILSDDLQIERRSSPSPEPSIHVDMQDYSSEEGSIQVKQTPQIGWTFYKNVLGQVNQILQNSPINEQKVTKDQKDNKVPMDQVKAATMEELTKMGISFLDNPDSKELHTQRKVMFDASSYSRLNPETNSATQGIMAETNTSLHMKALALKYLNDEQLSDLAVQKQRSGGMKQLMMSNVQNSNMSFATMHYLQRYQLLPGSASEELDKENFPVMSEPASPKMIEQRMTEGYPVFPKTPRGNYSNKILDITALKQQRKLL